MAKKKPQKETLIAKWDRFKKAQIDFGAKIINSPQKLGNRIKTLVHNGLAQMRKWLDEIISKLDTLTQRMDDVELIINDMLPDEEEDPNLTDLENIGSEL